MICKIVCRHCPAQHEIARWRAIATGFAILSAVNFAAVSALVICNAVGRAM